VEPDNKTLGQFLGENVFRKLGVGVHIGLRPEDQERIKIVNVEALSPQQVQESALDAGRQDVLKLLAKFINYNKETEGRRLDQKPPFTGIDELFSLEFWNGPEARRAELPSGGGLASARGLAVIAGHLARGGGDLLSRGAWQKMHQNPKIGFCFGMKCYFTQGGVADFKDGYDPSINVASCSDEKDDDESFKHYGELVPAGMYGWGGYGGSVFLWDPRNEIGSGSPMCPPT